MHLSATQSRAITAVLTIAVVTLMIPAAFMIGCTMPMTGPLCSAMGQTGAAFTQACNGIWVETHGLDAVSAAGLSTLLFALALALVAAVRFLFEDRREVALVPVMAEPPPPPDDPLGERLTL